MLSDPQVVPLAGPDRVRLCSDGLYSMVSEARIAEMMRSSTPEQLPDLMIAEANEQGGRDNISVIVLTR